MTFSTQSRRWGYRNVFYAFSKNRFNFAFHHIKQFQARMVQLTVFHRSFGAILWD